MVIEGYDIVIEGYGIVLLVLIICFIIAYISLK
jgi:hypothetical protein